MTDHQLAAFAEDVQIRTRGLARRSATGRGVDVHEIAPGVIYDSAGVRITAIPVVHGDWPEAFAYSLDAPDRRAVISGDGRPNDDLIRAADSVDVLVHSVYAVALSQRRSASAYFQQYHTSSVELGDLAAEVQPRLLLLTHIVYGGKTEHELVAGIRRDGSGGRIEVGKDLGRYR